MYRKRRKIRYYNGPASQERLTAQPWFPFVMVALAAVVLALILGAILGGVAKGDNAPTFERKNLYDFGGTEETAEKFASLARLNGDYLSLSGMKNGDLRYKISELEFGNAVVSTLYDGQGNVYYNSNTAADLVSLNKKANVTLDTLAERIDAKDKRSIGVFVSTAFDSEDEATRILHKAQETVILSEIASSDMDMILIVGLPCDSDLLPEVNSFLKSVYDLVPSRMSLAVAIDGTGVSSEAARLIAAAEAYADRLILDLRGLTGDALAAKVEQSAYYLTYYRMNVLIDNREDVERLDAYEGVGKLLLEKIS